MDFADTAEESSFRLEARSWLESHAELRAADEEPLGIMRLSEELVEWARRWQAIKADAGWACLGWPQEYGGRGASPVEQIIWDEEEGRFRTPPNVFTINALAGMTLIEHGTREQQERYVPPMLRGDHIWAMLFTEPWAGSDLAGVRTTAVRTDGGWRVQGMKTWTWGAHYAQFGTLLARTNWEKPKHEGLSYFVLDMGSPGVRIAPIRELTGAEQYNSVTLEDVIIPDSARVGAVDGGWKVAVTQLMHDRLHIGSGRGTAGVASRAGFEKLVALAQEVLFEESPAIEDGGVRQALADFYVRLEGIRLTGYRMTTALSQNQVPGAEASVVKLAYARLSQEMARFGLVLANESRSAIQLIAAEHDAAWRRWYLEAPLFRLGGGPDEIQRTIIADRVLGLPPEVRVDKGVPFSQVVSPA